MSATRVAPPRRPRPYLRASGIGDVAYFGPEAEFFIFDDVRYSVKPNKVSFQIDAVDAARNTDTEYEMGNTGHRAGHKSGYFQESARSTTTRTSARKCCRR
ncbi:MAG: hypothetical protein R3D59_17925 [Paracoccaceae bacterium]